MGKRLRIRGAFAPGAVLLQGRAACRSTRVGCEWGDAFGRAGHAVRTGGGAPTGRTLVGAPAPGCEEVSLPHHSGQGISLAVITSPSHPTTSIFFPFLSLISTARFGGR